MLVEIFVAIFFESYDSKYEYISKTLSELPDNIDELLDGIYETGLNKFGQTFTVKCHSYRYPRNHPVKNPCKHCILATW